MSCMCLNQLSAMLSQLKNLPLAMLMDMLPQIRAATLGVGRLSAAASAALGMSAAASASASAAATLGFSASAMANLSALANLSTGLGLSPFGASAVASLNITARSMTANLPNFSSLLSALLGPFAAALAELLKLASGIASLASLTGFNLTMPGVGASIATRASASLAASASASASMSANAAMGLRLNAAASALGINLGLPGGAARLNAAMALAASITPPTLALPPLSLLMGQTMALSLCKSVLGLDLLKRLLASQIAALLGTINANVSAAFSAALSASASAAVSAAASASAALSAAASVSASLMAGIPNLLGMSLAANVGLNLSLALGINPFAAGPCGSCRMF